MGDVVSSILDIVVEWVVKILIAYVIYKIGSFLIDKASVLLQKLLDQKQDLDPSIAGFFKSMAVTAMRFLLFIVVAGQLGIDTNSFIAIIGASVFAIAFAMQGALSNFAAGVMLLSMRPLKVGELVVIAGVQGFVHVIELFSTKIRTSNGHLVTVPNAQITSNPIMNLTRNGKVRVPMTFIINADDDVTLAKEIIYEVMENDDRVRKDPPAKVVVDAFDTQETHLEAQPWVEPEEQITIRFDLIEAVKAKFDEFGLGGDMDDEWTDEEDPDADAADALLHAPASRAETMAKQKLRAHVEQEAPSGATSSALDGKDKPLLSATAMSQLQAQAAAARAKKGVRQDEQDES